MGAAGVVFRAIPAMHGGEDAIRSALQRHMKVRGYAIIGGKKFYEVRGNVHRLDGTNAQAFQGRFVENAAQQRRERNASAEVPAVGSNIYATEDDFFYT